MTFLIIISCIFNAALTYMLFKFWKRNYTLLKRKEYYKKRYQDQKQQYFDELEEESKVKALYQKQSSIAHAVGNH